MILEVGFLIAMLLIASFYAGFGKTFRVASPIHNLEGFDDQSGLDTLDIVHRKCPKSKIDLLNERDNVLKSLEEVQIESHKYPEDNKISNLRVGLERLSAEISRGLEEDGRCISSDIMEAIIRASQRTFRPN